MARITLETAARPGGRARLRHSRFQHQQNNMEQGLAIMEAARACNAPVIIQASRGARTYANDIMLTRMIDALAEI